MKPALFLDRDGVINHDFGYVHQQSNFKFITGIFELVRTANELGLLCIIVTNQAGIGRGYYTENDFLNLTKWMLAEFEKNAARVDAVYHCPFHPTEGLGKYKKSSFDRKPGPGMFFKAASDFDLDLSASAMIGDKLSDMQAATSAGVKARILFTDGWTSKTTSNELTNYIHVDNHSQATSVLRKLFYRNES
jgi:D-glycero-D-manno-heptose 1,7-bisphosphate phosphatase